MILPILAYRMGPIGPRARRAPARWRPRRTRIALRGAAPRGGPAPRPPGCARGTAGRPRPAGGPRFRAGRGRRGPGAGLGARGRRARPRLGCGSVRGAGVPRAGRPRRLRRDDCAKMRTAIGRRSGPAVPAPTRQGSAAPGAAREQSRRTGPVLPAGCGAVPEKRQAHPRIPGRRALTGSPRAGKAATAARRRAPAFRIPRPLFRQPCGRSAPRPFCPPPCGRRTARRQHPCAPRRCPALRRAEPRRRRTRGLLQFPGPRAVPPRAAGPPPAGRIVPSRRAASGAPTRGSAAPAAQGREADTRQRRGRGAVIPAGGIGAPYRTREARGRGRGRPRGGWPRRLAAAAGPQSSRTAGGGKAGGRPSGTVISPRTSQPSRTAGGGKAGRGQSSAAGTHCALGGPRPPRRAPPPPGCAAGRAGRVRQGARTAARAGGPCRRKNENLCAYSVLKEWPHEHDFVTFGLLILNPEPIRLSM